jgi:putative membrane protein
MSVADMPALNALLNATCALLLLVGKRQIKRGDRSAHRRTMIAAFSVSCLFLVFYLVYHALHGSTLFAGPEWARYLYYIILGSHSILAAAVVPMAIITLLRGLRDRVSLHKKIARWTHPVWMYVSVTGVVVYLMLYQIFP